jgi:hypothetical protein
MSMFEGGIRREVGREEGIMGHFSVGVCLEGGLFWGEIRGENHIREKDQHSGQLPVPGRNHSFTAISRHRFRSASLFGKFEEKKFRGLEGSVI